MPKIKAPVHDQHNDREADPIPCLVTIVPAPATPAQLAAWRQLWARLLGHVGSTPEIPQPQDHVCPGAVNFATVASGPPQATKEASERVDALPRGEVA
jgi:hypothetical protein